MTRNQAILTEVIASRNEARASLKLLPIEAHERIFDLEAQLETLQLKIASGGATDVEPLLRQAQQLARELRALARPRAA
jgi:hypothetical protein